MLYRADSVENLTRELRAAERPFFRGLNRALKQRQVDPGAVALLTTFPDGENYDFCVIVTTDHPRPIRFGYAYPNGEEGQGAIVKWDDTGDPYADPLVEAANVETGLRIAQSVL